MSYTDQPPAPEQTTTRVNGLPPLVAPTDVLPSEPPLKPPFEPPPSEPPPQPPSHLRAYIAAAIIVAAVVIVGAIVWLTVGNDHSIKPTPAATAYQQKVTAALIPVVGANQALSSALQGVTGSSQTIHNAQSAVTQAQTTLSAARGAVAILTVPASQQALSQEVQQALTQENGYLQGVSSTLADPIGQKGSDIRSLATSTQTAFVPLASLAPGAAASISGTDNFLAWVAGANKQPPPVRYKTTTTTTTVQPYQYYNGTGPGPLTVSCFYNPGNGNFISASSGTTCDFANNAFYEYWQASGGDSTQYETIDVWSAQDGQYYALNCGPSGGGVVDCTDSSGEDVRFRGVEQYGGATASAYAASGKLGPNG